MTQYAAAIQNAQLQAAEILSLKRNGFLNQFPTGGLTLGQSAYVPTAAQFFRLWGFRAKSDQAQTSQAITQAVSQWLLASSAGGNPAIFMLRKQDGEMALFYSDPGFGSGVFQANLPQCVMEPTHLPSCGRFYSGVLLGSACAVRLADTIASTNRLSDCYIALIALPIADSQVESRCEEGRQLITRLSPYKSIQRTYGNATRRVEEVPIPHVPEALQTLQDEISFLERGKAAGFVHMAVRFGAASPKERAVLSALLTSCLTGADDSRAAFEPTRRFQIEGIADTWEKCLSIPAIQLPNDSASRFVHALSLQTASSAATFCLPPMRAYDGYQLQNFNVDENELDAFPATRPVQGPCVVLGQMLESRFKAAVPLTALLCHTGVFGATGSGKSTTVKALLRQVHQEFAIPFVVIEAAKKEYAALVEQIPSLKVYTSGADGYPLTINPLQPEDGTLIENHAAAVVRALTAITGGEHPIPEAFDGLLKQTYEEFGWKYGMLAYPDPARPFPTFLDVYNHVDSYIAAHAQYGPEVRQNLTAALHIRSEALYSGALGRLFNRSSGLMSKDFLSVPTVIELSDFSEQAMTFLMNILLYRFHCYLSRLPDQKALQRLLVVEEAHNVFRKTLSEDSGRALNNNAFEKMLAEIRTSGTGIIISDQRPSVLSDAVIANTQVKIIHAIDHPEDKDILASAAEMTDFQRKMLRDFDPGECVIAIRKEGLQYARIAAPYENEHYSAACIVCPDRLRCRKDAIKRLLNVIPAEKITYHTAKIQAALYDPEALSRNVSEMFRDMNITAPEITKRCLLGQLLLQSGAVSLQESRIILKLYMDHTGRCLR